MMTQQNAGDCQPEQQHESRLLVTSWSLHTLKGQPVLKLLASGKQYYGNNTVVNQDDFAWSDLPSEHGKWRGKITDCPIEFNVDGKGGIKQQITIALEKHSKITDGTYKSKGVMKSALEAAAKQVAGAEWLNGPGTANTLAHNFGAINPAATKPAAKQPEQPDASPTIAPKLRKMHLD
jgi:hypothetical protein